MRIKFYKNKAEPLGAGNKAIELLGMMAGAKYEREVDRMKIRSATICAILHDRRQTYH